MMTRAGEDGVIWLGEEGEEEEKVVVIHSKRTAVILREVLAKWIDEGHKK